MKANLLVMQIVRAWIALLFAVLLPWQALQAHSLPPVPALNAKAIDLSATLSTQERTGLEAQLDTQEDETGIPLTAVPESVAAFANRITQNGQIDPKNQDGDLLLPFVSPADQGLLLELKYALKRAAPGMNIAHIFEEHAHTGDNDAANLGEIRKQLSQQKNSAKPSHLSNTREDSVIAFISFVGFLLVIVVAKAFLSGWRACAMAASITGVAALLYSRDLGAAAILALLAALATLPGVFRLRWKFSWFDLLLNAGGSAFKSGGGGSFGGGGASGRW